MNIVCFAQTAWTEAPDYQRQLLGRLARRGHRVLVIEPESGDQRVNLRQAIRWRSRCRIWPVHDGLHVLTPLFVGGLPAPLARYLRLRTISAAAERLGQWAPVAICTDPDQAPLADALRPTAIVYLAGDRAVSTPQTTPAGVFDALLVTSSAALARFKPLNPHVHLLEVASGSEPFSGDLAPQNRASAEAASWQRLADHLEERLRQAMQSAAERRRANRLPSPRPDRHGRQVVRVEPRLDGKDASVRLLHDNYVQYRLSAQQHLIYLATRLVGLLYWALRIPVRLAQGKGLVRRILVVRNGHLGDTVVFLPTLAALRRRYPYADITVGLAPESGARLLLEASPLVDAVMPLDFFNRSRWNRFVGAMRLLARGFDLVVGGVWYFHMPEAVYSGAPRRLGLYDGHPLQRYADRVVMLDPTLHEAENNLRLVELVTGRVPLEQRVPRLKLDEPVLQRKAAAMREALRLTPDVPVVAMHPGSKRPSRRWPPEAFAELAAALLRERGGLQVVFTGAGRDEQELISQIREMIPAELRSRTHDGAQASDLLGVIGFYDTCKLLVCNDTGVMHVARARGMPLVAIIGPENDRRWGPHPLGLGPAVTVRNQVPGTPHGKWECEWNLSLASIEASRVKQHCDDILDGNLMARNNLKPIEADGSQLYPLVRDFRRLSFAQLQEHGQELPRVAIVFTTDPALLGTIGSRSTPEELAACARGMRQQDYPALEVILVTEDKSTFAGLDIGSACVVAAQAEDPDAAWAAVLGASNARLFWPAAADPPGPTAVANRVSVFLRGPGAAVVDDSRAWPARTLIDAGFVCGPWMIERNALEARLVHPLPPVKVLEEEEEPLTGAVIAALAS